MLAKKDAEVSVGPSKQRLIMWSGGCDSTMLLYNNLVDGNIVRTLAISHDQILSAPYERVARRKLLKEFRARGFKFPHCEITVKSQCRGVQISGIGGLAQAGIWLSAGIGHLFNNEDLVLAYIRDDDVWHYIGHLHNAFISLIAITHKTECDLVFPMEWDSKYSVVSGLKKAKLYSNTWYCEVPTKNGRRCGRCSSCVRMRF